jgi:hypothetical protein
VPSSSAFVFHVANGYEDADGRIVVDGTRWSEFPAFADLRIRKTQSMLVWTAPDGTVHMFFQFNDRGRGPKTTSVLTLDAKGIPIAETVSGNDYLKSPVSEEYSVKFGLARWKNDSEKGEKQLSASALYASINGAPAESATLIHAALSNDGKIALLPEGEARVERAAVRDLENSGQKRHVILYAVTGLAIIHYLLSPGIFSDQYLMSGMFFWLTVWRVLNRYGRGADARALAMLAVASCFFTVFFEAGWVWAYHGYKPSGTLRNNFTLDLGLAPAWQILALGLLIAVAAFTKRALRLRAAGFDARKIG